MAVKTASTVHVLFNVANNNTGINCICVMDIEIM